MVVAWEDEWRGRRSSPPTSDERERRGGRATITHDTQSNSHSHWTWDEIV